MSSKGPPSNPPDNNAAEQALDEWFVMVSKTLDELSQRVAVLEAQLHFTESWNMGLLKLVLMHEFRNWQQVGMHHQRTVDSTMSDRTRDQNAAEAAFDYFVKVMPSEVQQQIAGHRESLIEMLMDYGGHPPAGN